MLKKKYDTFATIYIYICRFRFATSLVLAPYHQKLQRTEREAIPLIPGVKAWHVSSPVTFSRCSFWQLWLMNRVSRNPWTTGVIFLIAWQRGCNHCQCLVLECIEGIKIDPWNLKKRVHGKRFDAYIKMSPGCVIGISGWFCLSSALNRDRTIHLFFLAFCCFENGSSFWKRDMSIYQYIICTA